MSIEPRIKDLRWIKENLKELMSKYPDTFIVVRNREIIFAHTDQLEVWRWIQHTPLGEDYIVEYIPQQATVIL